MLTVQVMSAGQSGAQMGARALSRLPSARNRTSSKQVNPLHPQQLNSVTYPNQELKGCLLVAIKAVQIH